MRKLALLFLVNVSQLAGAGESGETPHELNQWNPLEARSKIHSGGSAYSEPPTKVDSVITVAFRDEAARELFEQIGPDVKPVCSDAKGYRLRQKKGIHCSYTDRLENPANAHYRCWIGIDLRTGRGDVRVPC